MQGRLELLLCCRCLAFSQQPQSNQPMGIGRSGCHRLPAAKLGEEVQLTRRAQPILSGANQIFEELRGLGILA